MTSPAPGTSTGFLQITELQVPADEIPYNSSAVLTDLEVGGRTVAGFDPARTSYTVAAHRAPTVTATPADNATVAIVAPLTVPGTATVTVTSEDTQHTATYTVSLTRRRHPS